MSNLHSVVFDLVDGWADAYIAEVTDDGTLDSYKRLLRTAFKSGCLVTINHFAKAEVEELIAKAKEAK